MGLEVDNAAEEDLVENHSTKFITEQLKHQVHKGLIERFKKAHSPGIQGMD